MQWRRNIGFAWSATLAAVIAAAVGWYGLIHTVRVIDAVRAHHQAVRHGLRSSAAGPAPQYPVVAGLVGVLLIGALAVAAGIFTLVTLRPRARETRADALLLVGAVGAAVALTVGGWIVDHFGYVDPRLIYVGAALIPAAAALITVRGLWFVAEEPGWAPRPRPRPAADVQLRR